MLCSSVSIVKFEQVNADWVRFRGTDSIQTTLKNNDDVIIAKLCDFVKIVYFSFREGYINQILAVGLATDTKSSNRRCFVKKVFLKILQYSQEKHLCWSLFFIQKRLQYMYSSVNIAKSFRTPILKNICERLLLKNQSCSS